MYTINFNNPIHVHFIGIGGISMSGLAEILLKRHFTISGSDMQASPTTEQLRKDGAKIVIGQKASNITGDIDLVVYTAAIHESNEEFVAAKEKGIPMMTRAALLGQIMANFARSIAVSGTHGKTTTTSMLTHIFLQGQLDPTISVGGMLDRIGGNIRVGHSDLFLTEACEYTNSFLEFYPLYSIILNIEEDHLDFFKDINDIKHSFHVFASQTKKDGLIIINGDMEHTDYVLDGLSQAHLTFGLSPENDYSAKDITFDETGNVSYTLVIRGKEQGRISLKVKGRHNVMNSLAAIACAQEAGLCLDVIRKGLLSFGGTHRRFEYKGSLGDVTVIDDYAHHPTEIRATLSAAKDYPHDELWVIFQPHTYTRTKAFLPEFAKALEQADHVILADIYAAREPDTGLVSSGDIADLLKADGQDVHYFPSFEEIKDFVRSNVKGHDLLMTMGAGNVVEIGEELLSEA
ncbi:MAG: UDP-N-acetylmuramate--L-alanine ligase [Eubacterium sp.]|nr:UDP-N-acetylmuramate--L-alanine ligase [Eubacterium sp.]MDD7210141.1 UDP-N-acetylmuramate--L-alanine ligase [Lachnospiraceae bacterium]MDY5498366.1 UDP-N-acetylmuramate--L-alanine ligase [Anaerobutyricum sp.]